MTNIYKCICKKGDMGEVYSISGCPRHYPKSLQTNMDWEKEFDEKYCIAPGYSFGDWIDPDEMKEWIQSLLTSERKQAQLELIEKIKDKYKDYLPQDDDIYAEDLFEYLTRLEKEVAEDVKS